MQRFRMAMIVAASIAGASGACGRAPSADRLQTLSGEVLEYTASTRTIILRTPVGDSDFALGSDITIHEGTALLSLSTLGSMVGRRAKVRYDHENGRRTIHQLRVTRADVGARSFASPGRLREPDAHPDGR
jgi:hypothetical protein